MLYTGKLAVWSGRLLILAVLCIPLPVSALAAENTRLPDPKRILFWSPEEQHFAYRHMERLYPYHTVPAVGPDAALPLPHGTPLLVTCAGDDADAYMERNNTVGLLVLSDGKIILEKYRAGFGPDERWTSFSMAKSLTALLAGAAVKDGLINLDAPVSRYLPELGTGAYKQVTVRQLLSMTSGVVWNEDYQDKNSDVARLSTLLRDPKDVFVQYMASLPRAAAPGCVFHYSTGEDMLIGEVLSKATGKSLSTYLSEKIWSRLSMEKDAIWIIGAGGHEISGAGFSATLRDYRRLGLFALRDGVIGKKRLLPAGWMKESTTPGKSSVEQGQPYGYQWWINPDGSYEANGIFGQLIHIDPKRDLVIVILSAWPKATAPALRAERRAFVAAVKHALDSEKTAAIHSVTK